MPLAGCKIFLWSFAMMWTFSHHAAESARRRTCGHSSVYMHHRFRVVGGRISERGMWPWQIGIYQINYQGGFSFLCGGALVSRLWVLTAAHCFFDARGNFYGNGSMYLIKAGDHNLSIYETSQQEITPEMILVHHEFENSSFVNGDIALVKLSRKVVLNRFVKTVCLPGKNERDATIPHSKGIVAGWGITRALTLTESQTVTSDEISKVLRHAAFEIQSDRLCLKKSILNYNSTMTFCAGDRKGRSDACKGDSGGAFVRQIRRSGVFKQWVVIGVVSWGNGCAQRDEFGYYTRVYPFIGWIKKTMNAYIDGCKRRNGGCHHKCVNTKGNYHCVCRTGYKLSRYDRKTCTDIDECKGRNGGCHHECLNTQGNFYCRCKTGYELSRTDRKTCADINECRQRFKGGCSHGCVNTLGSYRCTCPIGFRLYHGRTCQDINECRQRDKGGCSHRCINTVGSYRCTCPNGFHLYKRKTCQGIYECQQGEKGGCVRECFNTQGSSYCTSCLKGFHLYNGRTCEDINECHLRDKGGCSHGCVNTQGSYYCTCASGFELYNGRTCRDINECIDHNGDCLYICVNTQGSYYCKCPRNHPMLPDGRRCRGLLEP